MKHNDIIFLLASSAILTVAWISFSVYHNLQTSTINDTLSIQIQPIQPHFDTAIVSKLKNRKQLPSLSILDKLTATTSASDSESPTPTPQANTPKGPNPTKQIQASESGGFLP